MAPLLSTPLLLRTQSDRRLVTLAADGHDRAFEAIVERYRRPLQRYLRRLLSEALAEDVLQATFVRAWQALGAGTEVRDLRPWLYRIAHNQALNTLRAAGAALPAATEDFPAVSLEAHVERREELRETLDGIQALPGAPARGAPRGRGGRPPARRRRRRAGHERRRPAPAPAARPHDAARRRVGADALPAGDVAGRAARRCRPRASPRSPRVPAERAWRSRPAPRCSRPGRWWPVAPRCAATTRPQGRRPRPSPLRPTVRALRGTRPPSPRPPPRRTARPATRPSRPPRSPCARPRGRRHRAATAAPATAATTRARKGRARAASHRAARARASRAPASPAPANRARASPAPPTRATITRAPADPGSSGSSGSSGDGGSGTSGDGITDRNRARARRPGRGQLRVGRRDHRHHRIHRWLGLIGLGRRRLQRRRLESPRFGRRLIARSCVTRAAPACHNVHEP